MHDGRFARFGLGSGKGVWTRDRGKEGSGGGTGIGDCLRTTDVVDSWRSQTVKDGRVVVVTSGLT